MPDLDLDFGQGQPPEPDLPAPAVGVTYSKVSQLPRGCIASDHNLRAVIVHPDGRYRRVNGPVIPAAIDSTSFGPYRIEVMDLDEAACAAWTKLDFIVVPQPPAPVQIYNQSADELLPPVETP